VHLDISGKVIVDASAAIALRRLINEAPMRCGSIPSSIIL
jgi:hypothetical protein